MRGAQASLGVASDALLSRPAILVLLLDETVVITGGVSSPAEEHFLFDRRPPSSSSSLPSTLVAGKDEGFRLRERIPTRCRRCGRVGTCCLQVLKAGFQLVGRNT